MKTLGLLLLWLVNILPTVSSVDFVVNPWTLLDVNAGVSYPDFNSTVGDTITFVFTDVHNVFIHPSGNCEDQTGRITVGNVSPVFWTFNETDGTPEGNPIFFSCDVDDHCELYGMSFTVFVYSALAPVIPPSDAPVAAPVAPSEAPVAPTDAPVAPTDAPVAPSDAPVAPSDAPVAPTEAPVAPTEVPAEPTDPPVESTDAPTVVPIDSPVSSPAATESPVADPTDSPTVAPVFNPAPTPMPNGIVQTTITDLRMTLFGIDEFPTDTLAAWEDETEVFSKSYIFSELQSQVSSFSTTYTVTDHFISTRRRTQQRRLMGWMRPSSRDLNEDFVTVIFTQLMQYEVMEGSTVTPDELATAPFATDRQRASYVSFLQLSADPILERVEDVTEVLVGPTSPPVLSPTTAPQSGDNDSSGLSTGIIIGIACGGGAFLLLIMAVVYFMYCRSGPAPVSKDDPPMNVVVKDDEVSTLAGPKSIQDGTQSVATVDYDYSKAYGGGDTSVSSAGGTFGSHTQNQSAFDLLNGAATGATLGAFDDDGSFEAHYRDAKSNVKEEILHVFAPAGKLGVVIDTPDDGAPVVHAVKESSVVADKVQVGDKLVAVDDEDVRTMTAVKVSKLISRKSANPSRKLTILRTTLIE